eukprot:RCo036394
MGGRTAALFREVLFALLGHPGQAVVEDGSTFKLHESAAVDPCDRVVIDSMLHFGFLMQTIERFAFQCNLTQFSLSGEPQSLYQYRMSMAVQELSASFAREVAALSHEADTQPDLPLVYIKVRLAQHFEILPELADMCI